MLLQFKHRIFKLSGHDMAILPTKFIEELRNVPEEELSSIRANTDVRSTRVNIHVDLLTSWSTELSRSLLCYLNPH